MEDHRDERVTDWRSVAPRWLLITALVVSFGINGLLGSMLANSVTARFDELRAYSGDPKWELMATLAQRQGVMEVRLQQHEDRIRDMDVRQQLNSIQTRVEVMNARLMRKGF
jgi:hypothetical protein